MNILKVKKLDNEVILPSYAKEGDAALDLRSIENVIIKPGQKAVIKTGLKLAIPQGHVGLIWDRSSIAINHDIHAIAGVIDSGFRGEVNVILKNLGDKDFQINKNDRIAQLIIQPYLKAQLQTVEELDETDRNEGGFGSTGRN